MMRQEFNFLKNTLGLHVVQGKKLQLTISRLNMSKCKYYAQYDQKKKVIQLRHKIRTVRNLFALLHEFGHVKQDVEGRLEDYWESFDNMWRLEKEANVIADHLWRKYYAQKRGRYSYAYRNKLSSYKNSYKRLWQKTVGWIF